MSGTFPDCRVVSKVRAFVFFAGLFLQNYDDFLDSHLFLGGYTILFAAMKVHHV